MICHNKAIAMRNSKWQPTIVVSVDIDVDALDRSSNFALEDILMTVNCYQPFQNTGTCAFRKDMWGLTSPHELKVFTFPQKT